MYLFSGRHLMSTIKPLGLLFLLKFACLKLVINGNKQKLIISSHLYKWQTFPFALCLIQNIKMENLKFFTIAPEESCIYFAS